MGSGGMSYAPSFIKTGSDIQNPLMNDTHTDIQQGDLISPFYFFQNKENRLTTEVWISSIRV
jgi:hypothetical protein